MKMIMMIKVKTLVIYDKIYKIDSK